MNLFFLSRKMPKEELICLIIDGLQKSILKIGLWRLHQLLQSVNGVVLLKTEIWKLLPDLTMLNVKNHKGKEHDFNNSKSSKSSLFFSRSSSSSTLSSSSQSSQVQITVSNNTLYGMILPTSMLNAEIKWSMKVVESHLSSRSCIDINKLTYVSW